MLAVVVVLVLMVVLMLAMGLRFFSCECPAVEVTARHVVREAMHLILGAVLY